MSKERYSSVWDAIEDTPREAASMKVRSELLITLQETLRQKKLTQVQAAKLLGVTQPRVSDLMRGKIELFSMEMLIDMLTQVGFQVKVTARKAA
ncbi:MAG: XRE family transcriptional regulator [Gammaproteobacteria bacterium]|nr:XRE family transcriptional regulator [Gammaproteobacteria bacterium]